MRTILSALVFFLSLLAPTHFAMAVFMPASVLSLSPEEGYADDAINPGMEPNEGGSDTTFQFKVVSTNRWDIVTPPTLVISDGTTTSYYPMTTDMGATDIFLRDDYLPNGEQYAYSGTFLPGTYTYHFDGTFSTISDLGEMSFTVASSSTTPPEEGCVVDCNDNVLFLPGVAGSRLYERWELVSQRCVTDMGTNYFKRWLPFTDCDNSKLYLNESGKSINEIATKDIVDEAAGVPDIYASFIADLKEWKETEHIIADYSIVPYDWRLSIHDIINFGKMDSSGYIDYTKNYPGGDTPYIMSELLRMASSSRTHKVTIVAHSNGGLIAKALMLELRAEGKETLVDKLIFVAVPEVGTPDAVATLLHGAKIGPLGIISDKAQTRELSLNMPTAYNLLPSEKYYETTERGIPIATFDESGLYTAERTMYGQAIGNITELRSYLLGGGGRSVPYRTNLTAPAIANRYLLLDSEIVHRDLDAWTPTSTTKVIEVAGWGEYTIGGLEYFSEPYCVHAHDATSYNATILVCDEYSTRGVLNDRLTIGGDQTVVSGSAHYLSDKGVPNVEGWWVDLFQYNPHGVHRRFTVSREHKDIFEVPKLRQFIKNSLTGLVTTLDYISQDKPISSDHSIIYRLHSPLTLNLYDSEGHHTGLSPSGEVEENIPGTRYHEVGDTKTIIADADISQHLVLRGYATGSFSLDIEKMNGDDVVASTTFAAIPSSTSTIVTLDLAPNADISTPASPTSLHIDFNGDGMIDTALVSKQGKDVIYDVSPPEIELSFDQVNKKLKIRGFDTVSSTTVVTTSTSTMVTDEAGNTTELLFAKYRIKPKKIELVISGIKQNGVLVSTSSTPLSYKWSMGNSTAQFKTLASFAKAATSSTETHFRPKKGITTIMTTPLDLDEGEDGDDVDMRAIKEKLPGVHLVKLTTMRGMMSVSY